MFKKLFPSAAESAKKTELFSEYQGSTSLKEEPRSGHNQCFYDGYIYFWGGYNGKSNASVPHVPELSRIDVNVLNTKLNQIQLFEKNPTTGTKPTSRSWCGDCLIGSVWYFFGGKNMVSSTTFADFYCLDLETKVWTQLSYPEGISQKHSVSLYKIDDDNLILWTGGFFHDTEQVQYPWNYQISTNSWSKILTEGTLFPDKTYAQQIVIYNDHLITVGGANQPNGKLFYLPLAATHKIWKEFDLPFAFKGREGHKSVLLGDYLLIFGGYSSNVFNEIWMLNCEKLITSGTLDFVQKTFSKYFPSSYSSLCAYPHPLNSSQSKILNFSGWNKTWVNNLQVFTCDLPYSSTTSVYHTPIAPHLRKFLNDTEPIPHWILRERMPNLNLFLQHKIQKPQLYPIQGVALVKMAKKFLSETELNTAIELFKRFLFQSPAPPVENINVGILVLYTFSLLDWACLDLVVDLQKLLRTLNANTFESDADTCLTLISQILSDPNCIPLPLLLSEARSKNPYLKQKFSHLKLPSCDSGSIQQNLSVLSSSHSICDSFVKAFLRVESSGYRQTLKQDGLVELVSQGDLSLFVHFDIFFYFFGDAFPKQHNPFVFNFPEVSFYTLKYIFQMVYDVKSEEPIDIYDFVSLIGAFEYFFPDFNSLAANVQKNIINFAIELLLDIPPSEFVTVFDANSCPIPQYLIEAMDPKIQAQFTAFNSRFLLEENVRLSRRVKSLETKFNALVEVVFKNQTIPPIFSNNKTEKELSSESNNSKSPSAPNTLEYSTSTSQSYG